MLPSNPAGVQPCPLATTKPVATVVGTVAGATVVGATVVGATVVGATVVGATGRRAPRVVGATVVGGTGAAPVPAVAPLPALVHPQAVAAITTASTAVTRFLMGSSCPARVQPSPPVRVTSMATGSAGGRPRGRVGPRRTNCVTISTSEEIEDMGAQRWWRFPGRRPKRLPFLALGGMALAATLTVSSVGTSNAKVLAAPTTTTTPTTVQQSLPAATPAAAAPTTVSCTVVTNPTPTQTTTCPGANLTGANLTGANLTGANLTGANLTGANLTNANLTDANLTGANLTSANLTGANLTGVTLAGATVTGTALVPANQQASAPTAKGVAVTWPAPTALPGAAAPESCSLPAGQVFPVGTTTVTCRVTDAAGQDGHRHVQRDRRLRPSSSPPRPCPPPRPACRMRPPSPPPGATARHSSGPWPRDPCPPGSASRPTGRSPAPRPRPARSASPCPSPTR